MRLDSEFGSGPLANRRKAEIESSFMVAERRFEVS